MVVTAIALLVTQETHVPCLPHALLKWTAAGMEPPLTKTEQTDVCAIAPRSSLVTTVTPLLHALRRIAATMAPQQILTRQTGACATAPMTSPGTTALFRPFLVMQ